jgi:hypothetical protein
VSIEETAQISPPSRGHSKRARGLTPVIFYMGLAAAAVAATSVAALAASASDHGADPSPSLAVTPSTAASTLRTQIPPAATPPEPDDEVVNQACSRDVPLDEGHYACFRVGGPGQSLSPSELDYLLRVQRAAK